MVSTLKTYLYYGTVFCGIEHFGTTSVTALLLQKKKNTLHVKDAVSYSNVSEICKILPKHQHAFLIINDDEVLSKQIESTNTDVDQLLYAAFPSISKKDFYVEVQSNHTQHLVAICRKTHINTLIDEYQKNKVHIINFSLGNTITQLIDDLIPAETYYTSNAISAKQFEAKKVEFSEEIFEQSYNVNGLDLKNTELLSFAGALTYIINTRTTIVNFESITDSLQKEFREKRFFSQFSKFTLATILLILLINFLVFNSYFKDVGMLKETSQISLLEKDKLLKLKTETDEKQKTVTDILNNASSKSSLYIDHISGSLPKTIQLSQLTFQPITKRIKKNTPIVLEANRIKISGISTDSDVFSSWIQALENFDWVASVTAEINGATGKNSTDFSLTLKITNANEIEK